MYTCQRVYGALTDQIIVDNLKDTKSHGSEDRIDSRDKMACAEGHRHTMNQPPLMSGTVQLSPGNRTWYLIRNVPAG